jgi:hypothetical protein
MNTLLTLLVLSLPAQAQLLQTCDSSDVQTLAAALEHLTGDSQLAEHEIKTGEANANYPELQDEYFGKAQEYLQWGLNECSQRRRATSFATCHNKEVMVLFGNFADLCADLALRLREVQEQRSDLLHRQK